MRGLSVSLVGMLVLGVVVASGSADATPSRGCAPPGARVIKASGPARVYVADGRTYACVPRSVPKFLVLGSPFLKPMPIARRGNLLAYGDAEFFSDSDDEFAMSVALVDLAAAGDDGVVLDWSSGEIERARVARLVIGKAPQPGDRDGEQAMAWTGCPARNERALRRRPVCPAGSLTYVWLLRGPNYEDGRVLVAKSRRIDAHSLRTDGERFFWRQGGKRRSARFSRSLVETPPRCRTDGITLMKTKRVRVFRVRRSPLGGDDHLVPWACLRPTGRSLQLNPESEIPARVAIGGTRVAIVQLLPGDIVGPDVTSVQVTNLRNGRDVYVDLKQPEDDLDGLAVTGLVVASDGAGAVTAGGAMLRLFSPAGFTHVIPGTRGAKNLRRVGKHSIHVTVAGRVRTFRLR